MLRAKAVSQPSCPGRGDFRAQPDPGGNLSIQALGQLERNKGQAGPHIPDKYFVQSPRLPAQHA